MGYFYTKLWCYDNDSYRPKADIMKKFKDAMKADIMNKGI